jgi:hypothetical protein
MFHRPAAQSRAPPAEAKAEKKLTLEEVKNRRAAEKAAGFTSTLPYQQQSRWSLGPLISLSITVSLLISSPFLYLLYTRLGFGTTFVEQPFLTQSSPVLPESALEIVAELPVPPGNVAVSSKGRIFFSYHPEYGNTLKVLELVQHLPKAFPSESFQSQIVSCLSLRIDQRDRLWILDFANHGISRAPQLFGFDLRRGDELIKHHVFPREIAGFGSMLNDFQVDSKGEYIYIADTSIIAATPAIIVYSVSKNESYRILSSHW